MIRVGCLQWVPEIAHHCAKTPFLLVGTQIDLRDDPSYIEKLAKNKQRPISFELGEKLAKELKAVKYVECSALTQVCFYLTKFFLAFCSLLFLPDNGDVPNFSHDKYTGIHMLFVGYASVFNTFCAKDLL